MAEGKAETKGVLYHPGSFVPTYVFSTNPNQLGFSAFVAVRRSCQLPFSCRFEQQQCGSNPTGATIPTNRRREILQLAREHDFLILEGKQPLHIKISSLKCGRSPFPFPDDPYYYLYYSDDPRPPSYFSLERELPEVGRVIRFDSLSKIISAGLRMGFVSGPVPVLQAIDLYVRDSRF